VASEGFGPRTAIASAWLYVSTAFFTNFGELVADAGGLLYSPRTWIAVGPVVGTAARPDLCFLRFFAGLLAYVVAFATGHRSDAGWRRVATIAPGVLLDPITAAALDATLATVPVGPFGRPGHDRSAGVPVGRAP
jgi:hypothetical protein